MKLNVWINEEIKSCDVEIRDSKKSIEELQKELKNLQHEKREMGRKDNTNSKLHDKADSSIFSLKANIEALKSKISTRKSDITEYKNLAKTKPVRLKTGAVVNSKIIDEMLKKLSGKFWTIEYTQYQDGLQIAYINTRTGSKGSFKVYFIAVISETIDLPIFEKGDVKECSIHS
ncbi:coiled-coil domain-containing protein [Lysinibacillus sp. RC79]|uniref:coiled-coil domain-containing protein n=1 Tax=Lysinibacillus sp. RC79 TaxID=3156296 RepID=UPI003512F5BC